MSSSGEEILTRFRGDAVDRGLRKAFRETVARHKALGQPMVFCDNGKPRLVPPEELVVPEEEA